MKATLLGGITERPWLHKKCLGSTKRSDEGLAQGLRCGHETAHMVHVAGVEGDAMEKAVRI
jgi:hypothetical protein